MKRTWIESILIAFVSVSASAQGFVSFDNYVTFSSVGAPIFLLDASHNLSPLPEGQFGISLFYQLGNVAFPTLSGTLIATTISGSGPSGPGYYDAGPVVIPDCGPSGAPPGGISFQVAVFGLPGPYGGSSGESWAIHLDSISTDSAAPTELDIPSFTIGPIPEPSIGALAGLGALILSSRPRVRASRSNRS